MFARRRPRAAPSDRLRWRCPLTLTAGMLLGAGSAQAQSVAPDSPSHTESSATQGSTLPPGIRPAKTQPVQAEAIPGGRLASPGLPQAIHWTEDWSRPPAADASLLERLKHLPLGRDDFYVSLGFEFRLYDTNWHHSLIGSRPSDNNTPLQSRLRLSADIHLSKYFRGFVELGDNREYGAHLVTGPNRDRMDLYQGFVDLSVPLPRTVKLTLRPGRFEMPLGNGKLVGVREGLNMRYTYQGIEGTLIAPGRFSIDVFDVRPINIKPGTFDDVANHATTFKGVYLSAPAAIPGIGTDLYWYAVNREQATLREGSGVDHRDNWGARIWKRTQRFDLDLEGDYQSGHFAAQRIGAWAVLFEAGYTLAAMPWQPRLGLQAQAFSGDARAGDGKAGTFVPAFPRLPIISEAAFFNLSNLVDLYPSLTVKPRGDVTIKLGPDILMREQLADGIYVGPAGASLPPYASGRYIGTDLNLEASWQQSKWLLFRLFETYFAAGGALVRDGGRSSNYFGLQADFHY